jgi:ubiquinone/menaquinone biosynthesis C-methylase UbiE
VDASLAARLAGAGSYRPDEAPGGPAAELERLKAQVALSWAEEEAVLRRIGVPAGADVLDLGGGPGLVAERLLPLVPHGTLTVVDADPAMVALAAARLRDAPRPVRVVRGSAAATGFPDDSFDVVLARYLFQHLADPVAGAREALRVLRPGGLLAVVEVDAGAWGLAEPFDPGVQGVYAKAERLQAARGGSRLMGRRLVRILERAGARSPRLELFAYHSDALGVDAFAAQLSPDRLAPALAAGVISDDEMRRAQESHARFMASPDAYVLMIGFLAHGRKPSR